MFLQSPYLLIDFRVLNEEKFTVYRVVDEQVHVLRRSSDISWHLQLLRHLFGLVLDVLQVFLLESLVLEELITHVQTDVILEGVQVLLV